jgi:hypothetical protein
MSKYFSKIALITSFATLQQHNKSFIIIIIIMILMMLIIYKKNFKNIKDISNDLLNDIHSVDEVDNESKEIIYEMVDNIDDTLNVINNLSDNKEKDNEEKIFENNEEEKNKLIDKKNKIRNDIKLICKKIDKNLKDPYSNNKNTIEKGYKNEDKLNEFILSVNSNTCSIPIFNMRKYSNIDYYHNFILHDFNPNKINNLIMCKDIHKWMSTPSLSNEDIADELIPIYYVKKIDEDIKVYEYLKIFIHTDDDDIRNASVQKGGDYLKIENDIKELIEKELIKDLLCSKQYINYNLSSRDGICNFLDRFLSHVLIPEQYIGNVIHLDINQYIENKHTYEYHLNTINSDLRGFNTTI